MTEECTLEMTPGGQARLGGLLTFETSTRLYHEMEKVLHAGNALVQINLSGVTRADSAGLALLLEWQAITDAKLVVNDAPESLIRLAELCGADNFLNLSGREEA